MLVLRLLIGLSTLVLALPAQAQEPEPLAIGETFVLDSGVLGEARRVNVYAPIGYDARGGEPLPVLYMPDGGIDEDFLHVAGLVQIGALNGTMRPFLLVGFENTARRRDLTPPTAQAEDREIAPVVGGSAAFRQFLRDELIPHVRATYATTDEAGLLGESLAGLFVVETFLLEPALFDHYLAVDPSLWWDGGRLVDEAAVRLAAFPDAEKTLVLASSRQPEIAIATRQLASAVEESGAPVALDYRFYPAEEHWTVFHPALLDAFRWAFPPEADAEDGE